MSIFPILQGVCKRMTSTVAQGHALIQEYDTVCVVFQCEHD